MCSSAVQLNFIFSQLARCAKVNGFGMLNTWIMPDNINELLLIPKGIVPKASDKNWQ